MDRAHRKAEDNERMKQPSRSASALAALFESKARAKVRPAPIITRSLSSSSDRDVDSPSPIRSPYRIPSTNYPTQAQARERRLRARQSAGRRPTPNSLVAARITADIRVSDAQGALDEWTEVSDSHSEHLQVELNDAKMVQSAAHLAAPVQEYEARTRLEGRLRKRLAQQLANDVFRGYMTDDSTTSTEQTEVTIAGREEETSVSVREEPSQRSKGATAVATSRRRLRSDSTPSQSIDNDHRPSKRVK